MVCILMPYTVETRGLHLERTDHGCRPFRYHLQGMFLDAVGRQLRQLQGGGTPILTVSGSVSQSAPLWQTAQAHSEVDCAANAVGGADDAKQCESQPLCSEDHRIGGLSDQGPFRVT